MNKWDGTNLNVGLGQKSHDRNELKPKLDFEHGPNNVIGLKSNVDIGCRFIEVIQLHPDEGINIIVDPYLM